MNGTVFWRIVWKEYRMQRAFWLAMAGLVVGLELLVLVVSRAAGTPPTNGLFAMALALAALYALGSGATLFAAECETGTYEFQRAIPVTPIRLLAGKVALAAVATVAMFAVLWLITFVIAGMRVPEPGEHLRLWGVWGIAGLELLVWGIFFSLLTARPLVAAILGVSAASLCVHLGAWTLAARDLTPSQVLDLGLYLRAIPYRLLVIAMVGAADVWLGRRWLGRIAPAPSEVLPARPQRKEPEPEARALGLGEASSARVLGRLVWQQWRQSRRTMLALAAAGIVLLVVCVWFMKNVMMDPHFRAIISPTGLAAALAGLLGSCVFLADQQGGRSRYLAEHGARPTLVWLSRQLVWVGPLVLVIAVAMALALLGELVPTIEMLLRESRYWDLRTATEQGWAIVPFYDLAALVVCGFLAYAAGQLTSMFLRSGILAVVFGLVLGFLLCGWALAMRALDVSWLWSVLPIPLVLLWTTWLRTADWIVERNGLRAWLPVVLSLGLPAAAIAAAIPIARVQAVPKVDPGFSPEEYIASTTAEGRATGEMYRRALDLLVPMKLPDENTPSQPVEEPKQTGPVVPLSPERAAWLKANSEALALGLKATERAECDYYDPARLSTYTPPLRGPSELGWLIVLSARQYQTEGNLEEASRRYLAALRLSRHLRSHAYRPWDGEGEELFVYQYLPSWAAHPGQTPQRIAEMLRQIDATLGRLPSQCDRIKTDYVIWSRALAGDPDAMQIVIPKGDISRTTFLLEWLPGEQARSQRVLNLLVGEELQRCRQIEDMAASGLLIQVTSMDAIRRVPAYAAPRYKLCAVPEGGLLWDPGFFVFVTESSLSRLEESRRIVRLVLGIEAWRLEHGELPKTLEDLRGRYLDRLPADPTTARPFRYLPQGLPVTITASTYLYGDRVPIPPGTPFLAGSWFDISVGKSAGASPSYAHRYADGMYSKEDVWYGERVFPLPSPGERAAASGGAAKK